MRGLHSLCVLVVAMLPKHVLATHWPSFAFDQNHSANNTAETILGARNVAALTQTYRVYLSEAVTSPMFIGGVQTSAGTLDLLLVTSRSGKLLAINGANGQVVWSQATSGDGIPVDSAPVIDAARQFVYGYGADGRVKVRSYRPTSSAISPE